MAETEIALLPPSLPPSSSPPPAREEEGGRRGGERKGLYGKSYGIRFRGQRAAMLQEEPPSGGPSSSPHLGGTGPSWSTSGPAA